MIFINANWKTLGEAAIFARLPASQGTLQPHTVRATQKQVEVLIQQLRNTRLKDFKKGRRYHT